MISKLIEQLAAKAPVATMFRCIFERILSEEALDEVFRQHRKSQVESPVLFSHLVGMLLPVISRASPSVNAAHQAVEHTYSRQAVYDKLKGVETQVSSALLRVSTEKLQKVRKSTKMSHSDIIKGFHAYVIDGKTYNATEHRLLETRTDARAPLPGRAIAILDMRYEMFVDIECDANAHRCERKIAEPLLERQVRPGALYIADRNFSDGNLLGLFHRHESYYIIRQHGACPSRREIAGENRVSRGKDELGGSVYEQSIEVQLADGSWQKVRRVTVELRKATRDGDRVIHLLTNLPARVKAVRIADAYRKRWTIENCLGHISRALNAEIRTLGYPGAAGLCFALALLLFNMMSLVRSMLLKHGKYSDRYEITDISYYYLADEIARSHFAVEELISRSQWQFVNKMSPLAFANYLRRVAASASLVHYRKHIRGPNKPPPKRAFNGTRHVAVQKLIAARK